MVSGMGEPLMVSLSNHRLRTTGQVGAPIGSGTFGILY